MTKAVFYGFQFPHHGQFSAYSSLIRKMNSNEVRVIKMKYPDFPFWVPGRVRVPLSKWWWHGNEYRLKKAFHNNETVHYFFPENSLFKAPEWKKKGKLILSCHQPYDKLVEFKETGKLQSFFKGLKVADVLVLMASDEIEAYREFAPESKIICIPHGVDTKYFSPEHNTLAETTDVFRVLTVGNWLRDFDLWAKVFEKFTKDHSDVEFTIIANPENLLKASENVNNGGNRLRLLSGISDQQLRSEYFRADVVFLPLKNAWANNALLEGMACGRPLAVTDLPATQEYAGEGATYIEKDSVESAISNLLHLKDNKDFRTLLGKKARSRIVENYSWEKIAGEYFDIYSKL
jgi:glycosyltransferase involved in cell wall biosynthesis